MQLTAPDQEFIDRLTRDRVAAFVSATVEARPMISQHAVVCTLDTEPI